jgi:hypothetical protein
MELDYNKIKSLSDEDFDKIKADIDTIKTDPNYEQVDSETLQVVERLLDLKEGTLSTIEGYLQKLECPHCKRHISLSDRVITGLIDAGHSKSFMVHTMLGNKRTLSKLPNVRCMSCATVMPSPASWHFWGFLYCNFITDPKS